MAKNDTADDWQNKNYPRLEQLPVSMFAIVIALAGLALAWEKIAAITTISLVVNKSLIMLASLVFIILTTAYLIKFILYPKAVLTEFQHPVRNSFFAAISISLLLLATVWLAIFPGFASILWGLGVLLHLFIMLRIVSGWLYATHYEITHTNPAWFMPVVGSILVPLIGVKIAPKEISWFFFSVGIIFWLLLLPIILNRLFFYKPLPERLLPTLFILLAPPSIASLAWSNLIGNFESFSQILYYFALFIAIVLLQNIKQVLNKPFVISAWAYAFPLVAFTIATAAMAKFSNVKFFYWLSVGLLYFCSGLIVTLFIRTLIAIWRKEICLPE